MNTESLSINLATVRQQWNLREAVEACARHGIQAVDPWRDQVAALGLDESARVIKDHGMRVTGYCRGGMFPAADAAGRLAAIDDNKRAIDEAAALGAECLVLVVGGLPQGSRDIVARAADGDGGHCRGPAARARLRGAARDRAAPPDVCRGPRLREHARAGARSVRLARRRARALPSTPITSGGTPRLQRKSRGPERTNAFSPITFATGWCRPAIC